MTSVALRTHTATGAYRLTAYGNDDARACRDSELKARRCAIHYLLDSYPPQPPLNWLVKTTIPRGLGGLVNVPDIAEMFHQGRESDKPVFLTRDSDVLVRGTRTHNVQINGGSFTSVGRDIHRHTHIHEATKSEGPEVDLMSALESIDNFRQIQQDTLSKATPRTGEWVFKHDMFPRWQNPSGDVKTFWGSGIPGAGKTVLISILVDGFESWANEQASPICVCYIYIRYNDNALTVRYYLEVLVRQIIEKHPDCLEFARKVYADHIRLRTRPTEEQLLRLLRSFTTMVAATFYFLDALDEARPEVQLDLVEKLSSLDVKLFVTSRPLKALEDRFPDAHHFSIVAQESDLDLLINSKLDSGQALSKVLEQGGAALRAEIVASVKRKCGGMFLHASLQLAALQHCTSIHEVKKTLAHFPPKIEDVYRDTWTRIVEQTSDKGILAQNCLIWVLNAPRSMTVEELQHAAATCLETHRFDPDRVVHKDTLVALCRGLLVFDEKAAVVRLVHYTAKQALDRLILETFPRLHSLMASLCLGRLIQHGFQRWKDRKPSSLQAVMEADPLLPYAYHAWSTHARNSLNDPSTTAKVKEFVKGCRSFPLKCDHFDLDLLGPLHVVAWFHLRISLTGRPLMNTLNPNSRTSLEQTALHVACMRTSHFTTVQDLLSLRFINVNATNRWERTPLLCACRAGNLGAVKLLLAHRKIKLNATDEDGLTAITLAARRGDEALVKLILSHSPAEVHSTDKWGRTALSWACGRGHYGTIKLLLSYSQSQVRLADNDGRTPLSWAASLSCIDTFKLVLSHTRDDVHLADNHGRTPLSMASSDGEEETAQILLAHPGTDVNQVDSKGRTPLSWAACAGREAMVKVLIAHPDIDVNVQDHTGRTPLSLASTGGVKVVKLLLAHTKIDVNLPDKGGRTALIWVARQNRTSDSRFHERLVAITKALLAHREIQVDLADNQGWTALTWASKQGHDEIVKLLVTHSQMKLEPD